jgi:acetoin utilization deacetylase AcuC-like enzyme
VQSSIAVTTVVSSEHLLPGHPESPGRFAGLGKIAEFNLPLAEISPRPAGMSDLETVHPPQFLSLLERSGKQGPGYLDHGDTFALPGSFAAARLASGSALEVLKTIHIGEPDHGFALIRPPGHHAEAERAMGFCLLNHAAICARSAQTLGYQKVMILDFDVHHGNGTQAIFENDADILYLSTHQNGIFPGTGNLHDVGIEDGLGSVANLPLPAGTTDPQFLRIFPEIVSPLASKFQPDFLIISIGFDTHFRDPLANLNLTSGAYFQIASAIRILAEEHTHARSLWLLEGGYDPLVVEEGVQMVLRGLLGYKPITTQFTDPILSGPKIDDVILAASRIHSL